MSEHEVRINGLLSDFVEVKLPKQDYFLKVMETLTRIGVASGSKNVLYQTCHILHKRQRYYILHFKEFFLLDGKESNFSDDDRARRNTIANLLAEWGLVELVDPKKSSTPVAHLNKIKVIAYKEKDDWLLEQKYHAGKRKAKEPLV